MKKFLLCCLLTVTSLCCSAQVFQAFQSAYKAQTSYGWSNWSDWQNVNVYVIFDVENDIIRINTTEKQVYQIIETENNGNWYTDNSGGRNLRYYAVRTDDGHRCYIRLRVETNGNQQIYVEYNDAILVFNVRRVQ